MTAADGATDEARIGDVEHVRLVVVRLARRLRRQASAGVTPSQATALSSLARNGPMAVSRLAEREQITKSSVTRVVARLVELGLAHRRPDPADGRSAVIAITAKGRAHLEAADRRADDYLARQLSALSSTDRQRIECALAAFDRLLDVRA
jgi:DNA-binding MarR family transcriptional regulator